MSPPVVSVLCLVDYKNLTVELMDASLVSLSHSTKSQPVLLKSLFILFVFVFVLTDLGVKNFVSPSETCFSFSDQFLLFWPDFKSSFVNFHLNIKNVNFDDDKLFQFGPRFGAEVARWPYISTSSVRILIVGVNEVSRQTQFTSSEYFQSQTCNQFYTYLLIVGDACQTKS